MAKRFPYLFVGWLWFSITIAPVIGIIQISLATPYTMADRYHYLPSIGLAVMMAWGIPTLIKSEEIRKKILFPAGIIFLAIMAFLSWNQCGYWTNSFTLFSHALWATKNNYLAHNKIGLALDEKGRNNEAIYHYNKAIHIKPDYAFAYNNRGISYGELGQYQQAIKDFNKAISIRPTYVDAYNNRGINYGNFGQYQQAIEDYNKAIRLKPNYADAYNNRGTIYVKLSQYQLAIEDFNKAIDLKQDYADAYNNRGVTYFKQGNNKLCCHDIQKACKLGKCKTLEAAKSSGHCR